MIMKIKNNRWLIILAVVLFFIVLTFVMTFPLFIKINVAIAGFHSTDEPSPWYFWWLKFAHTNNLDSRNCQYLSYPFGQEYRTFQNLFPLWSAWKNFSAISTNPLFAYNIEGILSFVLSGLFMFMLADLFLNSFIAALFAGVIYAVCPYHFARLWQHIGLAHIQWMPLYLYSLFRFKKKDSLRNTLFVSLALFLVGSFDLYYLYFMLIVLAVFIFYVFVKEWRSAWVSLLKLIIANLFALLLLAIIILPASGIGAAGSKSNASSAWSFNRPFEDLFVQSARPLSYILPSTEHPVLGKLSLSLIGSGAYGVSLTEHALYLGWLPLIFAFITIKWWRRSRKHALKEVSPESVTLTDNFYIGFFVLLAIAAWLFSQPPWWNWFGLKIFMPSFVMYKILPMFRAYCRFGIILALCVAVLAGFGLRFYRSKFKNPTFKAIFTVLCFGVVLFEFWNWPPYKIIDYSRVPQAYYWLKEQPEDTVIAEYPLDCRGPNEKYKFYQTVHEKRMINGTIPSTYPNLVANAISSISSPNTCGILKWMGVKYIFIHRQSYLDTELSREVDELNNVSINKGLKFVRTFPAQDCTSPDSMCLQRDGQIDVYEVVAKPLKPALKE